MLEEAHADVRGFADNYIDTSRQQNELRDMFKIQQSQRFEATGGTNQHISLNAFAIRKTLNVKRLKNQLWEALQPKLNSVADRVNRVRSKRRDQQQSAEEVVTLTNLMDDLYFESKQVDPDNVSVASAFICLLHLANEQNLSLEGLEGNVGQERDFKISKLDEEQ